MFFSPAFLSKIIITNILLLSMVSAASIPAPQKLMEDTSDQMISAFIDNADAIKANPSIAHD